MPRFPGRSQKLALRKRIAPYAAIALLGFALVTASINVRPGLRSSRRDRLVDLIEGEDGRVRGLRAQLDGLQADVQRLEADVGKRGLGLSGIDARIAALAFAAGTAEVTGPGLTVELRDSTRRVAPSGDPNDLVIHEQDLQAIVNALWRSGAEAMAINGERITALSAVRCVGNTLLLHGSVYAPPYRLAAIGNASRLRAGLRTDDLVQRFTILAQDFRLGFDVRSATTMVLPPFRGLIDAPFARSSA